jgi:hypothetical protein
MAAGGLSRLLPGASDALLDILDPSAGAVQPPIRSELFGREREMPPLACAIHNTIGLSVAALPAGFFEDNHLSPTCVVQHYCPGFAAKYKTPKKQPPPFEQNNHYFWEKVKRKEIPK